MSNLERGEGWSTNTGLWLRLSATPGGVEKRGRSRGDTRGLGGGLSNLGTRDMVPWCVQVLHWWVELVGLGVTSSSSPWDGFFWLAQF